jgi:hypothetical protein
MEGSNVWWPMEGSNVWWPMEGKTKTSFSPFLLPLPTNLFELFFSIDIKVLRYHSSRLLLYAFPSFSLTYKLQPCILMYQILHTFIIELILIKDFFPFFEFMTSHMTMFYKLQTAQVNKKLSRESFLNLILTQHPRDEDLKLQEVCPRLKVEPP